MTRQCSSCGGFCKRSGCERANVVPKSAVDSEPDANRYRWLKENSAKFSWNPSRYNGRIVDGFAAFGTGYLGYNFEQAVDLAMQADAMLKAREAKEVGL